MTSVAGDVYSLVAAILHMIAEIQHRLAGDLLEHPVDGVLHNLNATAHSLAELTPIGGGSHLTFRHAQRDEGSDLEPWFSANAASLLEYIDRARIAWTTFAGIAERDPDGPVDDPYHDFEQALAFAEAHARVLHDQIVDEGLIIERNRRSM